ncbi:MAG: type II secretion system F family protein [Clostridiales bacterium]|nr:type II secretion system F family protein [Clostridiales bacterium]
MIFLSLKDMLILGIGCICLLMWLVILFGSRKYDSLFDGLDEKEYPLKELYSTGYAVMQMSKYKYRSKFDRKLRQELDILYEKKYVDYYMRVTYARAFTYGMLLFLLGFVLYGLSASAAAMGVMFLFAFVAVYYVLTLASKKITKRSEALMNDFSEVVSKLALLTNAGMILREAWEVTARAGEGLFYEEMRLALDDMENGVSEMEAIRRLGLRCVIPEIKKFSATITQGIQKGNSELSAMLQDQSAEVWNLRKQNAHRQGEKAASKLMIPIFIMFLGVIIMIIVPIFSNLGSI